MASMDTATSSTPGLCKREAAMLLLMSAAAMVLGTLDQCTRGPSLTAMALSQLRWLA